MSTSNLFKPVFSEGSSLDNLSTETPTTLNNTLSTSTDTNVPLFQNAQKDLSTIAPAFFIGVPEKENKVTFQAGAKETNNAPTGYGDRRLSGILSETIEKPKKEEQDKQPQTKQIRSRIPDATRGLFGSGVAPKRLKVDTTEDESANEPKTSVIEHQETKSIRVFGYPTHLVNTVIQHFVKYGKIERYEQSPGNWITIFYKTSSSANAALKSNGVVISKNYLIGVSLNYTPAQDLHFVKTQDKSGSVYKKSKNADTGLGSGKAGVSALDQRNTDGSPLYQNLFTRVKESFLGW